MVVGVRLERDALDHVRETSLGRHDGWHNGRAASDAEPFIISIDRVRNQLVERSAGLHVKVSANQKLKRGPIAAVELELVRTIIRQTSVSVIEQALQIEQEVMFGSDCPLSLRNRPS